MMCSWLWGQVRIIGFRIFWESEACQEQSHREIFSTQDAQEGLDREVEAGGPRAELEPDPLSTQPPFRGTLHTTQVNMEGYAQDSRYLYFLLEFVAGGELFTYLRSVGKLES